ncbi:MAG TPA: phosphate ABC transporter permease PstA [Terriglobales bacterium]|nr:phosphate ABC transporter permease PstA [Terriglobales bacterium]
MKTPVNAIRCTGWAGKNGIGIARRLRNNIAMGAMVMSAVLVIAPLIMILTYLAARGAGSLNWAFFTHIPTPVGENGGGMANAIAGSGMILLIASAIGMPIGIGSGVFLAEYGRNRLGDILRFTADVLNGVPSIVLGVTAYSLLVVTQKHFSAFAGGVALAIMMIPTISRSTEEMLLMVPHSIREAALGLGIPRWRTIVSVVLPAAKSGIVTGMMLGFSRVAGETAPLLFTAFGNQFWNWSPTRPTAALPLQIYTYAISPFDEWHRMAWAGALVLILLIVGTVAVVRLVTARSLYKVMV